MYHLPTHPVLYSQDPLSICDEPNVANNSSDDVDLGVRQAKLLTALMNRLRRQPQAAEVPKIVEDIAYSIHFDGSMDTGYLKSYLQSMDQDKLTTAMTYLQHCALALSSCFPSNELPVLGTDIESVTLSASQVDSLLAHQFLGTLAQPPGNEWGIPCFTSWYASNPHHKSAVDGYLDMLLHHFATGGYSLVNDWFHYSRFTSAKMPDPSTCTKQPDFVLNVVTEESEPSDSTEAATFVLVSAHSQPGPGPSGTHEERLQAASPALAISSLVSPLLSSDAAVVTSAFPVHGKWKGHNRTARLRYLYTPDNRPKRHYILADALELDVFPDNENGHLKDLQGDHLEREVRKLYAGFSGARAMCKDSKIPLIEAPAWGCRSFGGNVLVKAMAMMIAAALAGVKVQLTLVNDRVREAQAINGVAECGLSAAELWQLLGDPQVCTSQNTSELRDAITGKARS